ncbi:hypothetical protein [Pantoea agglomerans]|uniref:hypothetical protein n=1 Tax=Enterobacter agglomerans TaxID=549 RepID=UPI001303AEFF|nr:hypothetical protein [Pantoea agglomerans]
MKQSSVKRWLTFGDCDYNRNLKVKLIPFFTSRLAPFASFALITIIISKLNYPELGRFSYLTAMFSLPVVLMSMPLAMIGNLSVEKRLSNVNGKEIFLNGLPFAASLSMAGFIVSVLLKTLLINSVDSETIKASAVYVSIVPMLIINTYLFYFVESYVSNVVMAKVKVITALLSGIIIFCVSFYVKPLMTHHVFYVFAIIEVILMVLYLSVLIKSFGWMPLSFEYKSVKSVALNLARIGLPVSLGLAGQKLVYFLITQRITGFDMSIVSDLSVLMSCIAIFALPFGAFAQIHSLYISGNNKIDHKVFFKKGMIFSSLLISLIIGIAWVFYPYLIDLYGADKRLLSTQFFVSVACFFTTSSIMLLCMSHLRALQDTFIPQSIAVCILVLGFIPAMWIETSSGVILYKMILLQSLFTCLIITFLVFRIWFISVKGEVEGLA